MHRLLLYVYQATTGCRALSSGSLLFLGLIVALLPCMDVRADPDAALPPGISVIGHSGQDRFRLEADGGNASIRPLRVQGQAFQSAVRINVASATQDPWGVQYMIENSTGLEAGDVVLASFYIRCQASMTGECFADVKFEENGGGYYNETHLKASAASPWKRYDLPFKLSRGYQPGGARLTFQLGTAAQQIDIGGIELTNYGPDVDINTLPKTRVTYAGREPDAGWREAAEKRIDQYRKGDLAVRVIGPDGGVLPDARVRVQMTRHAFLFGSAVTADAIVNKHNDPALTVYREKVKELFTQVVFENDLKWQELDFLDPDDIDPALQWLASNEISVRGHVLVWPGWNYLPKDLPGLADQPEVLERRVIDRVRDAVTTYRGRLDEWDVLNEPYNNHDLMDILGRHVMVDWFKAAREADPEVKLYINDWGILTSGSTNATHVQHYLETIRFLLDNGAPVDGVGMQGHFGAVLTPPEQVIEILDVFAELGLEVKVTELDLVTSDPELAADYMRDLMTVLFSHPSVDGILHWGFWAGRHWKPGAALYDRDWNPRPHGQAFLDLVRDAWWTDESLTTDARGESHTRGFLGRYRITVEHGRQVKTLEVVNDKSTNLIEVQF